MIFVTVGTQLPFERLVSAVEAWAAARVPKPRVVAQVGAGRADFRNLQCVRTLDAAEYSAHLAQADVVIAHAGVGSILNATERGVPVVVLPRDPRRGEHRDDHQFQTARQMERMGLVTVAWSEEDLPQLIEHALSIPASERRPRSHDTALVDFLRDWLAGTLDRPSR